MTRRIGPFPALQALEALLYAARCEDCFALFPGSSVVEQPAVNRLVAGSNPARGAKHPNRLLKIAGRMDDAIGVDWRRSQPNPVASQNSFDGATHSALCRFRSHQAIGNQGQPHRLIDTI